MRRDESSRGESSRGDRLSKSYPYFNQGERVESSGDELRGAESSRGEMRRADRLSKFVSFQIVKH